MIVLEKYIPEYYTRKISSEKGNMIVNYTEYNGELYFELKSLYSSLAIKNYAELLCKLSNSLNNHQYILITDTFDGEYNIADIYISYSAATLLLRDLPSLDTYQLLSNINHICLTNILKSDLLLMTILKEYYEADNSTSLVPKTVINSSEKGWSN